MALAGLIALAAGGFWWLSESSSDSPDASVARPDEAAVPEEGSGDLLYGLTPAVAQTGFDEALADETPPPTASPSEPTIVLAILDTVRADRTSICGDEQETTPFLASLVREGAAYSCRAYAPGDWSVPTHASYFTGASVTEHGAHYSAPGSGRHVDPMRDGFTTLAEDFSSRGYQTVVVSDNRLLAHGGLERGFVHSYFRPSDHDSRRPFVPHALRRALREDVDPSPPIFLVLNFLAAHDPWPGPPDVDLPPPAQLAASIEEALGGEDAPLLITQVEALYDHGVRRADAELESSHRVLADAGWLAGAHRVVVVSDHGNMLIEHGLLGHYFIWEENVRVPLVYVTDGEAPTLPEPLSALVVHSLLRDGALPDPMPVVHTVSVPRTSHRRAGDATAAPAIAVWAGSDKLVWMRGGYYRIDLATDPDEFSPEPLGEHPQRPALEALVTAMAEAPPREATTTPMEVENELRALGYIEPP